MSSCRQEPLQASVMCRVGSGLEQTTFVVVAHAVLGERASDVAPDEGSAVVVHCGGPGCNGSTLAALGCTCVRELIGGFEHWAREDWRWCRRRDGRGGHRIR